LMFIPILDKFSREPGCSRTSIFSFIANYWHVLSFYAYIVI
jgi:hypothetical protein